ncbi:MAG TPA: nucleoside-diphosphate sugar epimerase/dehydratase [Gemmatimonadaceae bacterium]|nr:nucleoside-diphosphate sugar epimerase/dehydratase [Gemmatimonadaceae bacterium]
MRNLRVLLRSPVRRRLLIMGAQLALCALGWFTAFAVVYEFRMTPPVLGRAVETVGFLVLLRLVLLYRFQLDHGLWRHVGLQDLLRLAGATVTGSLLLPLVLAVAGRLEGIPLSVFILEGLFALLFLGSIRIVARVLHERLYARFYSNGARPGTRTFIIGAGDAGEQLLRQLLHDSRQLYDVVGLIDDDATKRGCVLHGVAVLGAVDDLRWLAAMHRVGVALIAIPSARADQLRRIIERCMDAGLQAKLLPPLQDTVTGDVHMSRFRDVQVEDLLGRDPVTLDLEGVAPEFGGQVILITGAGGSIGSELARQVVRFHPRRVILLERAESPLYFTQLDVQRANPSVDVVPVLASVTNEDRLDEIFERYRPDSVFHAAAYKHVPLLEANVVEGVWNNVIGTLRLARCAAQHATRKFVLISTDKAVNPSSILGVTKLLAERVVLELPSLRASGTDFRVVRFGNVLGSDGSVVPLFKRQLAAGGPLTVTHPEVRRYFMTIPEAVQLVLQASVLADGAGRIALLEMGTQVRIVELAEQLIRLAGLTPHMDVKIEFTGLRPGEKLEEELVAPNERALTTGLQSIRVVERNGTSGGVLAQRLRHLAQVTALRNEQVLLRTLAGLVPEYQPLGRELEALADTTAGNGHRPTRRSTPARRGPRGGRGVPLGMPMPPRPHRGPEAEP